MATESDMLSTSNELHSVSIFNDRINMVDLFRGKERATEHLIRLDASFPIRHGIRHRSAIQKATALPMALEYRNRGCFIAFYAMVLNNGGSKPPDRI